MRHTSTLSVAGPLAAAAAVAVAACGAGTAPTGKIETRIQRDIRDKTHLRAGEVTCPDGVKAKKAAEFDCTARVEEAEIPVHVTLTNGSGTRFDFRPTKAVLLTTTIVRGVQDQIKAETGLDATVDCGAAKVLVRNPGDVVECSAKTATETAPVRVTVKDVDGNVNFTVGQ